MSQLVMVAHPTEVWAPGKAVGDAGGGKQRVLLLADQKVPALPPFAPPSSSFPTNSFFESSNFKNYLNLSSFFFLVATGNRWTVDCAC